MNYIEQINYFWQKHEEHVFGTTEVALYFHLLDICNKCGWTNPFKRRNTLICAQLGVAKGTLERARNKLKQAGMIDFQSNGKGDTNIKYHIADCNEKSREKFKNWTSYDTTGETSPESSGDTHNINLNKNLKKGEVVTCEAGLIFFRQTQNFRLLREKYHIDPSALEAYYENFYSSKVDLGEFKGKRVEDLVKHFSSWLPIHIQISEREKSSAKKENAGRAPERGVAAVVNGFTNVTRIPRNDSTNQTQR